MKRLKIKKFAGEFAEDKDCAAKLRNNDVYPELELGHSVELDFSGVAGATQSFVHALIAEPIRKLGSEVIELLAFKGCNDSVKGVIGIVIDYVQVNVDEDFSSPYAAKK